MRGQGIPLLAITTALLLGLLCTSFERSASAESAELFKAQALLTEKSNELYNSDGDEPYRITDPKVLVAMHVCGEASDLKSLALLANLSVAVDSTKKIRNLASAVRLTVSSYPAQEILLNKRADVSAFLFTDLEREKNKCLRRTLRLISIVALVGYEDARATLLKKIEGNQNLEEVEFLKTLLAELAMINPIRGR